MPVDVVMPRLSDSMEEGTILKWMKGVGDEVALGDELVEIETDKANMVFEADAAGTLIEIVAGEGDTLPIGEVIARVGEASEAGTRRPGAPTVAMGAATVRVPRRAVLASLLRIARRRTAPPPPLTPRRRRPTPRPRTKAERPVARRARACPNPHPARPSSGLGGWGWQGQGFAAGAADRARARRRSRHPFGLGAGRADHQGRRRGRRGRRRARGRPGRAGRAAGRGRRAPRDRQGHGLGDRAHQASADRLAADGRVKGHRAALLPSGRGRHDPRLCGPRGA